MASDWKEVPFNDLGEVGRGKSKHRPRYAEYLYGGKYPFIQTGDIRSSNGRVTEHTQTYSEEGLAQSKLWPKGTMCITIAANIAETAILTYPACFPDSVVGFIANEDKCDVRFVEYSFRLLKRRLQSEAIGSVQDNINLATLSRLNIKLPPLPQQKAIAHILSSLDNKIELNRRMNETLEAMAQALFKSWFVDFDPVIDNALAAGNAIPDEFFERAEQRKAIEKKDNSDIQKLFPDEFEFSEDMGWIPKGWASDTVKELANVTDYVANGSFASLKENVTLSDDPEYALYIRTTDYKNDFSLAKAKYVNKHSYDFLKKSILEGYEVIISNVGDTGTVFRPPVWLNQPMTLGSNAIAIKNENMSNFLQYYFSSYFGQYQISSIVGGSAQPKFNKTDFRALAVYFGSLELVSAFEEACQPLRAKIDTNLSQILLLSNIHNTLLPKLMSGELRIPDAEALVENV